MGLVRVLPCVLSELYFFTSYYMHIRVFHDLELPVLYFRRLPDDIATKKYG